jgi:thiol-disulfide isomerase/thioredoxin
MKFRLVPLGMLFVLGAPAAGLVPDVRKAIAANDLARGESLIDAYKTQNGVTPEMILALSWLGRGALAGRDFDRAGTYATRTRELALEQLKTRKLDDEKQLPLALGASIEVHGHVLAGRNQLSEAIGFLQRELKTYHNTSIRTRIQKNIHLLSLEGKPAPRLEMNEWLGARPPALASLKGKPVLLFFWAHWCGDCKYQGPILSQLQQEFGPAGLVVMGPTQRYGYVAGGVDAEPAEEKRYIDKVRLERYAGIAGMTVPLSEENFKEFGCSTTPTLVLIDRQGIVRMYHPGKMSYDELAPIVHKVVGGGVSSRGVTAQTATAR